MVVVQLVGTPNVKRSIPGLRTISPMDLQGSFGGGQGLGGQGFGGQGLGGQGFGGQGFGLLGRQGPGLNELLAKLSAELSVSSEIARLKSSA